MSLPIQLRSKRIEALTAQNPALAEELRRRIEMMEKMRALLIGRFPMGVGDSDLYKAFCWASLYVLKPNNGLLGLVLPKTTFSAAGMQDWRRELQKRGSLVSLTYLTNSNQWVFNIHAQYSIALMVYASGYETDLEMKGPIHDLPTFQGLNAKQPVVLNRLQALRFTASASIPSVSDPETGQILSQMRLAPDLRDFENGLLKPVSEFHATNDRGLFDHGDDLERLEVYSGKSFNLWQPRTGEIFAMADPKIAGLELRNRIDRQVRLRSSAFFGLNLERDLGDRMPFERPRIALRGVTNATNSRTVIACLIPANIFLTNMAPYFISKPGHERDEAYALAFLSSIPFDWYARKFVDAALNFHLLSSFPLPTREDSKRINKLIELSGQLAAVDSSFDDWAKGAGVSVGNLLDKKARDEAISEVDAIVALEYGLTKDNLTHIYSTFHRGWEDVERLKLVLSFMDKWGVNNERH
jgi:hypothetical protein